MTLQMEVLEKWLRGLDSNQRPQGYGPCELPTALPRDRKNVEHGVVYQIKSF